MPLLPVSAPPHAPKNPTDLITCSQGTRGACPCPGTRWQGGHRLSLRVLGESLAAWVLLGSGASEGAGRTFQGAVGAWAQHGTAEALLAEHPLVTTDVPYDLPARRLELMTVLEQMINPELLASHVGRAWGCASGFPLPPRTRSTAHQPPSHPRGNLLQLGSFSAC